MSYDLRFEGGERQELYLAPRRQDRKGRSLGDPSSWRSPRLGARIGFSLRLRAVRALRVWVVGNYAKRTQFSEVKCAKRSQSPAMPAGRGTRSKCATSPRCPASGNKAKPGQAGCLGDRTAVGRAQGKCAKQSQFGPGSQTGARVAGRARRGTTAPNKANSRRGKKKGKCLAGKDLW
jgi:hypothetical protein